MNYPTVLKEFQKLLDARSFFSDWELSPLHKNEISGLTLFEDDDHLYLEAAVPGLKSEEIQISVEKGVVWIQGEKKIGKEDSSVKVHFQTKKIYSYRVPLPARIDENATPEASCKDGILTITFAKSRASKPIRIQIKPSE